MHQHVAIMFTDIQGYTAMMQKDEKYAIETRTRYRELIQNATVKHKGTILQYYGDGTLIIFNSALDAVQCGTDLQLVYRQEPGIPVRIGIHFGEIIHDKDDIVGDGVALARRLESLSLPGGILISSTLKNKIPAGSIQTSLLGKYKLDQAPLPIELFSVDHPGLVMPDHKSILKKVGKKSRSKTRILEILGLVILLVIISFFFYKRNSLTAPTAAETKSIAVLPFINMSDNPFQEYFSDGVTEEIINHLSEIKDLKVISKTSVMKYKNSEKSVKTVGRELGVSNILEGSVRRDGDQIRVTVKLINVETDTYLWTKSYDRQKSDIFSLEIDLTLDIVHVLQARYTDTELAQIEQEPTQNFSAFDYYLKAINRYESYTPDGLKESTRMFQETIEMDPGFDAAYARLALCTIYQASWIGEMRPEDVRATALFNANKALELNPDQHLAHNAKAVIYFWFDWNFEEAEKNFRKAQESSPPGANSIQYMQFLINMGRFEEALDLGLSTLKTDPLHFGIYLETGLSLFFMGQYPEAIRILKKGIELNPEVSDLYIKLGKVYLNSNRYFEAVNILQKGLEINPSRPPSLLVYLAIAKSKQADRQAIPDTIEELKKRRAGGGKGMAYFLAHLYSALDEREAALEWLETAYQEHEVELIWLKVEPQFANLRSDERFMRIEREMGFLD